MARHKSITDNLDKLLDIASRPKPVKVKKVKTYPCIDEFIAANKIKSGRTRVPTYIIYYHYFLWKNTRLVKRKQFINYFKTKFEKTRTIDGVGFLLSPTGFDLSPTGFFKARAYLRKERDEQKKDQKE
jgi:hypothetical protein